jgi:hypothetical protein
MPEQLSVDIASLAAAMTHAAASSYICACDENDGAAPSASHTPQGRSAQTDAATAAVAAAAAAVGDSTLPAEVAAGVAGTSSSADAKGSRQGLQRQFRWDIVALMLPPTGIGADCDLVPGMLRSLKKLLEPGPFWAATSAALSGAQTELEDSEAVDVADQERTASALASGIFESETQKLPERAAALRPVVEAYLSLCTTCRLLPMPSESDGLNGSPAAAPAFNSSTSSAAAGQLRCSPRKCARDTVYAFISRHAVFVALVFTGPLCLMSACHNYA